MSIQLEKNESIPLIKGNTSIGTLVNRPFVFGIGFTGKNGLDLDLDSYVAVLDKDNQTLGFVYFNNLKSKGIKHNGDDTSGGGNKNTPNETIKINLSELHANASKLIVGMFIFSGASNLSDLKSSFANITNSSGLEVCRFDIKDSFSSSRSVELAEFHKNSSGEWCFTATGKGSSDKYRQIRNKYTVKASSQSVGDTQSTSLLGKLSNFLFG